MGGFDLFCSRVREITVEPCPILLIPSIKDKVMVYRLQVQLR